MKNRVIKFRCFYIDKWVYFTIGQSMTNMQRAIYDDCCLLGLTFYEFTGITDKYGVEVYEGDVVKTIGSEDEIIIGAIFWNICCWSFGNEYTTVSLLQTTKPEVLEVIGNIYQPDHTETGKDGGR